MSPRPLIVLEGLFILSATIELFKFKSLIIIILAQFFDIKVAWSNFMPLSWWRGSNFTPLHTTKMS